MRLSKDQTVRGVVVSLVVVVVLLVPLSVVQNRISGGSTEGLNLAEVFAFSRGLHHAQEPITGLAGAGDDSNATTLTDFDTRLTSNSSADVAPLDQDGPVINRGEAKGQRVFQPASIPHYSFVKFSAYRQSLYTFFVTGITSYVARTFDKDKIAHTCEWHPSANDDDLANSSSSSAFVVQSTQPDVIYMKDDENHGTYGPAIINCTFATQVGAERRGGVLVIRISTGYNRWNSSLPVVTMEELPGDVDAVMTPPEKLPFKYAFCGAPIHGEVRADWLLQWTTYHHYLANGQGHFFFYNMGGISEQDKAIHFTKFLNAGLVSFTNLLDPSVLADYPTWYFHQVLLINDCLHRSRFMAERVFFFDYDEFLQIPAPDTLSKFMSRHKDEPWISFGSIYANTRDCRNAKNVSVVEAPVERMLWRRPAPECRSTPQLPNPNPWLCIGPPGRRKYVVNPRKTFAGGVHWALVPETGLNLLADEAHILHYRSAPVARTGLCAANVTLGGEKERKVLDAGWIRDESVSKLYSKAKSFPVRSLNANPPP